MNEILKKVRISANMYRMTSRPFLETVVDFASYRSFYGTSERQEAGTDHEERGSPGVVQFENHLIHMLTQNIKRMV